MPGSDQTIPQPGDLLAGKFEVVRVVASGGMGVVLEAVNRRTGQHVALKLLHFGLRARADVTLRFEREGRTAGKLSSRHVARILDVESLDDGSPFLVMELLRGRDLGEELEHRKTLPYEEAVGWVLEACAAMAEAHAAGIVHRDLKPSNLFLADEPGGTVLKVLDFGISKTVEEGDVRMTATHSVLGTPLYMSPEHVRSTKDVDARSDLWSLGVILYELVTGDTPFHGSAATAIAASIVADEPTPVTQRCPWLPAPLAAAIMRALSKRAGDRQADVGELARELGPYGGERGRAALALIGVRPRQDSITVLPPSGVPHAGLDAPTVVDGAAGRDVRLDDTDPEPSQAAPTAHTQDATGVDLVGDTVPAPPMPAPPRRAPWAVVAIALAAAAAGAIAIGARSAGRGPEPAAPGLVSSAVVAPAPSPSASTVPGPIVAPASAAPAAEPPVVAPASAASPAPRPKASATAPPPPKPTAAPATAPPPRPASSPPDGNPLHL